MFLVGHNEELDSCEVASTLNTPLLESFYNSPFYLDYLKDEHFHHSDKGCSVKMIMEHIDRNWRVNKICQTHNCTCSKTGWELNWYMGTYSKEKRICTMCGAEYKSRGTWSFYCPKCKKVVKKINEERTRTKQREKRLQKKLQNFNQC